MDNCLHGYRCQCDQCQRWRNSFDWLNHSRTGKYTGIQYQHPIPRDDMAWRTPQGPNGVAELNHMNDVEFERIDNSPLLYGERLCRETDENRAFHTLEALARRCYWGDVNETHTGYKACLQFLFGPQCLHEPYLIIHARHAEKYVVDYEKDGVKNRIYSPFEFRVAYHNASATPEMKRKRNIYLIFLEPANRIRPYEANMVGGTAQAWKKNDTDPRKWELYDLIRDDNDEESEDHSHTSDPYRDDNDYVLDSDDESEMSESNPLFDEWLFGEVPEAFPNADSFDLFKEFEAIHHKVRQFVLAGTYPAEDYRAHIHEYWIPDYMMSEKMIFNMPPFTYSDRENFGVPYVVMPDFRWSCDWNEYCRQSDPVRSLVYLPRPIYRGRDAQRLYHERPWTIIDNDAFANGRARFPTEEETDLVRSATVHAEAKDTHGWDNLYRFAKLKHRAEEWTNPLKPFEGYYASQWDMWRTHQQNV